MEVRRFNMAMGTTDIDKQNLYTGPIPDQLVVGLVQSNKIGGILDGTFHDFSHYDLSELWVTKGSTRYPDQRGYSDLNFKMATYGDPAVHKKGLKAYEDLMSLGKKANIPYNIPLTFREWCEKCTLFYFDITDGETAGGFAPGVITPVRSGSVEIHARFDSELPIAVDLVVLSITNNVMELSNIGAPNFNF